MYLQTTKIDVILYLKLFGEVRRKGTAVRRLFIRRLDSNLLCFCLSLGLYLRSWPQDLLCLSLFLPSLAPFVLLSPLLSISLRRPITDRISYPSLDGQQVKISL